MPNIGFGYEHCFVVSTPDHFGFLPSGEAVDQIQISGGGLNAAVLTYGATVQSLHMRNVDYSLVLGSNSLADYLGPLEYVGAVVGRFANRIGGAEFTLDGKRYPLDRNETGINCLHGGSRGTSWKNWRTVAFTASSVTLEVDLADGEMGFPGNLHAEATFSLPGNDVFQVEVVATTDKPTPCSFAHHGYFNLDGTDRVSGHMLRIDAEDFLAVDGHDVPVGPPIPVEGTHNDYRQTRVIGDEPIDRAYCLSPEPGPLRPVAWLFGPKSGLTMRVETTEAGLQVYNGAHFQEDRTVGNLNGRIGPLSGLAIESQCWPDAPNRPDFPGCILRPGDTYRHTMRYIFSSETANPIEVPI